MEISHVITIDKNAILTHELKPQAFIQKVSQDQLLLGPCRLSFTQFSYVALKTPELIINKSLTRSKNFQVMFFLVVVDEMEKKPLLKHYSAARSLWLLGEIVDGICESLQCTGLREISISAKHLDLLIKFEIPADLSHGALLGSGMCLVTLIDSLLFARGLCIANAKVLIGDEQESMLRFFALYKQILMMGYNNRQIAAIENSAK
jgi:hypothetical protein